MNDDIGKLIDDASHWNCSSCGNRFKNEELEEFKIPVETCAVSHSIIIGDKTVWMCPDCLEKKGEPIREYLGRTEYSGPIESQVASILIRHALRKKKKP